MSDKWAMQGIFITYQKTYKDINTLSKYGIK